jgi:DNA-binding IclR family transcriptional regulator
MRKREHDVARRPEAEEAVRDPQFITALARGLDVLRAFRRDDQPLGNQELARRTTLPKPTVSRITYTLTRLGYLTYLPDLARYKLSVGVMALGYTSLGSLGIRDLARPLMRALAEETGISVALGARDRLTMVYLEVCKGDSPFPLNLEIGSHIKLATSAMGRAHLAALSKVEFQRLSEELARHEGKDWPAMRRGIERAADDYRRQGFVVSAGDWKSEVNAVGAPILIGQGEPEFALNCGGPAFLVSTERLTNEIGPKLAALALRIRQMML